MENYSSTGDAVNLQGKYHSVGYRGDSQPPTTRNPHPDSSFYWRAGTAVSPPSKLIIGPHIPPVRGSPVTLSVHHSRSSSHPRERSQSSRIPDTIIASDLPQSSSSHPPPPPLLPSSSSHQNHHHLRQAHQHRSSGQLSNSAAVGQHSTLRSGQITIKPRYLTSSARATGGSPSSRATSQLTLASTSSPHVAGSTTISTVLPLHVLPRCYASLPPGEAQLRPYLSYHTVAGEQNYSRRPHYSNSSTSSIPAQQHYISPIVTAGVNNSRDYRNRHIYSQPQRGVAGMRRSFHYGSTFTAFSADDHRVQPPSHRRGQSSSQRHRTWHPFMRSGGGGGGPGADDQSWCGSIGQSTTDGINTGGNSSIASGNKSLVTCIVTMLDGREETYHIQKSAKGHVLFEKVCKNLDLHEKEYFGLTYRNGNVWFWLSNDKRIRRYFQTQPWHFEFQVKFYPTQPSQLKDALTRYLLCLQVRQDLVCKKLPCSFGTFVLLGAYIVQSELGDFNISLHGEGFGYIQDFLFAPETQQSTEMLHQIAECHKHFQGMSQEEADLRFLENSKKLALYGVDFHKVKDADNEELMLGVCHSGILIYIGHLRMSRFFWSKILKISYLRSMFRLFLRHSDKDKTGKLIEFRCLNSKMAKRLWKACVDHHAFFRLRDQSLPLRRPNLLGTGTQYRQFGRSPPSQMDGQVRPKTVPASTIYRKYLADKSNPPFTLHLASRGYTVNERESHHFTNRHPPSTGRLVTDMSCQTNDVINPTSRLPSKGAVGNRPNVIHKRQLTGSGRHDVVDEANTPVNPPERYLSPMGMEPLDITDSTLRGAPTLLSHTSFRPPPQVTPQRKVISGGGGGGHPQHQHHQQSQMKSQSGSRSGVVGSGMVVDSGGPMGGGPMGGGGGYYDMRTTFTSEMNAAPHPHPHMLPDASLPSHRPPPTYKVIPHPQEVLLDPINRDLNPPPPPPPPPPSLPLTMNVNNDLNNSHESPRHLEPDYTLTHHHHHHHHAYEARPSEMTTTHGETAAADKQFRPIFQPIPQCQSILLSTKNKFQSNLTTWPEQSHDASTTNYCSSQPHLMMIGANNHSANRPALASASLRNITQPQQQQPHGVSTTTTTTITSNAPNAAASTTSPGHLSFSWGALGINVEKPLQHYSWFDGINNGSSSVVAAAASATAAVGPDGLSKKNLLPPPRWRMSLLDISPGLTLEPLRGLAIGPSPAVPQSAEGGGGRAVWGVSQCGQYYYEVIVTGQQARSAIRVGWSVQSASLHLGEDKGGFGFGAPSMRLEPPAPSEIKAHMSLSYPHLAHRWDNSVCSVRVCAGECTPVGDPLVSGDVIGCYLDLNRGAIFWSCNGFLLHDGLGIQIPALFRREPFFPAVAINNCSLLLNFGESPFTYPPTSGNWTPICRAPLHLIIPNAYQGWRLNPYDATSSINISADGYVVQAYGGRGWQGIRANRGVRCEGIFYYEVTIMQLDDFSQTDPNTFPALLGEDSGVIIGWSTEDASLELGSDEWGVGYGKFPTDSTESNPFGIFTSSLPTSQGGGVLQEDDGDQPTALLSFACGDIIGCLINLNEGYIAWNVNGKILTQKYSLKSTMKEYAFFPAITLKNATVSCNFGNAHLRYKPDQESTFPVSSACKDSLYYSKKLYSKNETVNIWAPENAEVLKRILAHGKCDPSALAKDKCLDLTGGDMLHTYPWVVTTKGPIHSDEIHSALQSQQQQQQQPQQHRDVNSSLASSSVVTLPFVADAKLTLPPPPPPPSTSSLTHHHHPHPIVTIPQTTTRSDSIPISPYFGDAKTIYTTECKMIQDGEPLTESVTYTTEEGNRVTRTIKRTMMTSSTGVCVTNTCPLQTGEAAYRTVASNGVLQDLPALPIPMIDKPTTATTAIQADPVRHRVLPSVHLHHPSQASQSKLSNPSGATTTTTSTSTTNADNNNPSLISPIEPLSINPAAFYENPSSTYCTQGIPTVVTKTAYFCYHPESDDKSETAIEKLSQSIHRRDSHGEVTEVTMFQTQHPCKAKETTVVRQIQPMPRALVIQDEEQTI